MNNPIISPWVIYLIDVATDLDVITAMFAVVAIIFGCVGIIAYIVWRSIEYTEGYDDDEKRDKLYLYLIKKGLLVVVALFITAVFIPTKETAYKMLVASYVTEENVEKATDAIKSGVDYIFEKFDEE